MKKLIFLSLIAIVLCTIVLTLVVGDEASPKNAKHPFPFSVEEFRVVPNFNLQKPQWLTASDGIKLAYYAFVPTNPKSVIIFYHGSGSYTNKYYQWIGLELQQHYGIASYMIDIRGHGHSEGPRGDTPTIDQVYNDVDTVIEWVKKHQPDLPLYLAGHSSGSGLLLNYNEHGKQLNQIAGYIFLAPYLGPASGTIKTLTHPSQNFVTTVRTWLYILNALLPPTFLQHIPAIYFNYPPKMIQKDPLLVTSYTYAMSMATTPYETKKLFGYLKKPFALFIGRDDEIMIPEKSVAYKEYANHIKDQSIAEIVPHAKHLSILLQAPALINRVIQQWQT